MPQVKCKLCGKEFYVKPSQQLRGYGKYCSRGCHHLASRKGKIIVCDICGKEAWKIPKDLKNSKSGKFFCSKHCQTIWRNKYFSGERHPLWNGGRHSYRSAIARYKTEEKCRICGCVDKRVLAVHHFDKNRKNNKKENLVWVCHNCHHLIHYYSAEIK